MRAVLLLAAALPLASAAASASTSYTVVYQEYMSGVGQYYNSTTQQIIVESIQEQVYGANPSSVTVAPNDFPIDSGFILSGVTLNQWNKIPHTQDVFIAGLASDLNVNATQITLGGFTSTQKGLLVPFTVSQMCSSYPCTNSWADSVAQKIPNEVGGGSGVVAQLASIGLQPVNLILAPPPLAPASATAPSVGVILNVTLVLPNITAVESITSGNPNDLFQLGLLRQDLNANGLYLGSVGGGMYVVVGSLAVTGPGSGDATGLLAPLAPSVYLTSPPPPSPPGTVKASAADRAVAAMSALLLAVVAALV
jgi:hypothetical protein